jgi:hypothetical protein
MNKRDNLTLLCMKNSLTGGYANMIRYSDEDDLVNS